MWRKLVNAGYADGLSLDLYVPDKLQLGGVSSCSLLVYTHVMQTICHKSEVS